MRGSFLFYLLLCITSFVYGEVNAKNIYNIKIASEKWPDGTKAKGVDFAQEIMNAIFDPAGIQVTIQPSDNYKQSIQLVKAKQFDCLIPSHIDQLPWAIYPKNPYDHSMVVALTRKGDIRSWKGEKSLKGLRVAWIEGYNYQKYCPFLTNFVEVKDQTEAFRLLEKNKIDAFLNDRQIAEEGLKTFKTGCFFEFHNVFTLALYPAFRNTDRSKELIEIYDQRLSNLKKTGVLKRLYLRYKRNKVL